MPTRILSLSSLTAILSLVALSLAQTVAINYAALPACATKCTLLTQAQDACDSAGATAESCFCQSAYLTQWKTNQAVDLCAGVCQTADLQKVSQWYNSACQAGNALVTSGAVAPTTLSTQPAVQPSSSINPTGTSTGAGNPTATANDQGGVVVQNNQSWISGHWKWIVMVIVIFLGMMTAIVLGIWLKRRHHRKQEALAVNMAATDAYFAPPPPMTHTNSDHHPKDWAATASSKTLAPNAATPINPAASSQSIPSVPAPTYEQQQSNRSRTNTLTSNRSRNYSHSIVNNGGLMSQNGSRNNVSQPGAYPYHLASGDYADDTPSSPTFFPSPTQSPVGGTRPPSSVYSNYGPEVQPTSREVYGVSRRDSYRGRPEVKTQGLGTLRAGEGESSSISPIEETATISSRPGTGRRLSKQWQESYWWGRSWSSGWDAYQRRDDEHELLEAVAQPGNVALRGEKSEGNGEGLQNNENN